MMNKISSFIILVMTLVNIGYSNASTSNLNYNIIDSLYCPLTNHYIIDDATIADIDNLGTNAVYIQIAEGYNSTVDVLKLQVNFPNITALPFDSINGKLTLQWNGGGSPTFNSFSTALKNVVYYNSSLNPSGQRKFSITIGSANYLPLTGHYYEFVPSIGISWIAAKAAAEARDYFGMQGYLATITSQEEANLVGKQTTGAGWIGGSDAETEGDWKWVTGPETGTLFWKGQGSGYATPPYNFAFWNSGEPNQYQGSNEDFAHITTVGIGIPGAWNDLTVTGNSSGDFQAKGYLVEYGGMPGDPALRISSSSSITIPQITSSNMNKSRCGAGIVTLNATSNTGNVYWYASPTGGIPLINSLSYSPNLGTSTTYYISAFDYTCITATRIPVLATINEIPTISSTTSNSVCGVGSVVLAATSSVGSVNWYDSLTATIALNTGNSFTTPSLLSSTTYFVEAFNNGCTNGNRVPVIATVNIPPLTFDEEVFLCEDGFVDLDAQSINIDYEWSTGAKTQTIQVSTTGVFTIKLTDLITLCSSVKTFTVTQLNKPTIKEVLIDYNTATIITEENGDYEYSIDGVNYQLSPVFENLQGGLKSFFVRESTCSFVDVISIPLLIIPRFITPNFDTHNDFFEVEGLELYPDAYVQLFDKFGKILYQQKGNWVQWDGTFKGKQLPSSDYWYVIQLSNDEPLIKGHFTLLRK